MNPTIDVMLVTNSNYLLPTITTLCSLFDNNPVNINVYILYSSLNQVEVEALKKFAYHWEGKTVFPLYVEASLRNQLMGKNGYPVEMYYRILGIDLLPQNMTKVLYMDVDVLIKGSIMELYQTNIENYAFAVCEDIYSILGKGLGIHRERTNVPSDASYFNSGVMLFNLEYLRLNNAAHTILNKIKENFDHYVYVDQDALNELYCKKVTYVPWALYNCPPRKYIVRPNLSNGTFDLVDYGFLQEIGYGTAPLSNDLLDVTEKVYDATHIIHYAGSRKPWKDDDILPESEFQIFGQEYIHYAEKATDIFTDCIP
ncbi:MAG TPA: glycosyltransferase family 8 protein [Clostridiales bacterium]|nr:glycosyltransferase family 8 protein [Clostridiales bacterium]